jgi:hypothetical protein
MSKVAIQGDALGTGTFTIASPNSNSDRTLTLPDNSGTVLTSATTTGFPAGSVLQVVHASTTTEVTNTTNIYADTTLTATITPTSATSKILVLITQHYYKFGANANSGVNIKLFRGATDLGLIADNVGYTATTSAVSIGVAAFQRLDTPSTTSPVAYKTQFANAANASGVRVQNSSSPSTITLMEIAA